jgi:hypothetical protein
MDLHIDNRHHHPPAAVLVPAGLPRFTGKVAGNDSKMQAGQTAVNRDCESGRLGKRGRRPVARQERKDARWFVRSFVHIKTGMPPYGAHPCFTFSCPGFAGAYIALSTIPNTGITVSIEQKAATPSFGMIFIGTSIFKMADPTSSTHLRLIYVASQYVASAK